MMRWSYTYIADILTIKRPKSQRGWYFCDQCKMQKSVRNREIPLVSDYFSPHISTMNTNDIIDVL